MAKPSFFDPFTATSLDHPHTLVQQGYNNVQVTYKNVQDKHKNVARPSQKQSSENCRQVELHNHDNWKTVANRVHMCPTVCKWHQTSYIVGTRRIDGRVPFTICQHFPGFWHEVDFTPTRVCGWGGVGHVNVPCTLHTLLMFRSCQDVGQGLGWGGAC